MKGRKPFLIRIVTAILKKHQICKLSPLKTTILKIYEKIENALIFTVLFISHLLIIFFIISAFLFLVLDFPEILKMGILAFSNYF